MRPVAHSEGSTDLTSAAVFEQYRERIYRHILHLVHDPTEAEELTQETFLRVHRKLESLQDPSPLLRQDRRRTKI